MRSLAIAALAVLSGCATLRTRSDERRLHGLLGELRAQGFQVEDPLAVSKAVKEQVEREVGVDGTELERMTRLHRYLRGELKFRYDADRTVGAQEAWDSKRGDCLSYAHLFTALARFLKVPVDYIRYRGASAYEEREGNLVVVSHVASLYNDYRVTVLVELTGTAPSWRVSDYERLGDDEAYALHLSNLAMEHLAHGDTAWAEKVLELLSVRTPDLPEVQTNLAAVLMREGHHAEALALLQRAIGRFHDFTPLYVDASIAARELGKFELANQLAEDARSGRVDPFVPFTRGVWLMDKGKYDEAAKLFSRARELKPGSALFAAWLARAQLLEGYEQQAVQTFALATRLDPRHPVLADFRRLHPAFRDCAACVDQSSM